MDFSLLTFALVLALGYANGTNDVKSHRYAGRQWRDQLPDGDSVGNGLDRRGSRIRHPGRGAMVKTFSNGLLQNRHCSFANHRVGHSVWCDGLGPRGVTNRAPRVDNACTPPVRSWNRPDRVCGRRVVVDGHRQKIALPLLVSPLPRLRAFAALASGHTTDGGNMGRILPVPDAGPHAHSLPLMLGAVRELCFKAQVSANRSSRCRRSVTAQGCAD